MIKIVHLGINIFSDALNWKEFKKCALDEQAN